MRSVELGTRITTSVEFRLAPTLAVPEGALGDPGVVQLLVHPPAGVDLVWTYPASAEIIRDSLGLFHADHTPTAGRWVYRWVGSGSGPNAVVEDEVWVHPQFTSMPLYGATREGVADKYLVTRKPLAAAVAAQVDRLLEDMAMRTGLAVDGRLAKLEALGADVHTHRRAVGSLVEMATASLVTDSAFPERAATEGTDQSYGSLLWGRYQEGLSYLTAAMDAVVATATAATEQAPADGFPDGLMVTRGMIW